MTPQQFIQKWQGHELKERSAAQEHFIDLCRLIGHPTPAEADKKGDEYTFEKGVTKTGGGEGFADVWKRGHFGWEYKKKKASLEKALEQLTRYASALENPPLHVACDTDKIKIVTAWTNSLPVTHDIALAELADPAKLNILHAVFHDPQKLRPQRTRAAVTKEAAEKFVTIAERLQHRNDHAAVAHFVNQLVFCFFAEDVRLLPEDYFTKLLHTASKNPKNAKRMLDGLFEAMEAGGPHGVEDIRHFNGGLFDGRRALDLDHGDIGLLVALGSMNWSQIDPTIFGTLFERFLDPEKRAQIGAHYTDETKIMMIVEPVIVRPLLAEWEAVKTRIGRLLSGAVKPGKSAVSEKRLTALGAAEAERGLFLDRLRNVRILDPACGSGNFLYLALQAVKDIENRVLLETEAMGLSPQAPLVGPEILRGIEINRYAAELARTTIWIGFIQWKIRNAIFAHDDPVLRKLDGIENRDALVTVIRDADGTERSVEAEWPDAEFIVGNPPFLGGKLLRASLGDDYVGTLFGLYDGRVSREADLVTYWFEKARTKMAAGKLRRAGLVSTNSIRGGVNRKSLERLMGEATIFEAWADEPWVVDGAAVRVSLVCFAAATPISPPEGEIGAPSPRLDGRSVACIHADLTAGATDLTQAKRLKENVGVASNGITKKGKFEIPGRLARDWLKLSTTPAGRVNSDVIRPWRNGLHLMRDWQPDMWIVDFTLYSIKESEYYTEPYEYIRENVKPFRERSNSSMEKRRWWQIARPASALNERIKNLGRYMVTPEVSKHRVFSWFELAICADKNLVAIARDDDATFGILHSRFHEAWSLRLGTSLEDRPRYTPTTTFETFPFPEGLTPNIKAENCESDPRAQRIAAAAKALDDKRRAWLNPPDLVDIVPEITPTAAPGEKPVRYPDRILPKNAEAALKLKERTLTNLYNQRPAWLAALHGDLDRAVAAAYGWPEDISTDAALEKLLALNLERAAAGR